MCCVFYKCSAEFNVSVPHLAETGLEHAFVVNRGISNVIFVCLFVLGKYLSLYFLLVKAKKKRKKRQKVDNMDTMLFLEW